MLPAPRAATRCSRRWRPATLWARPAMCSHCSGGGRRHQVEDRADLLGRGGDVVQLGQVPAGVVDFQLQAEPLAHRIEGDGVDVVGRLQPVQGRQRLARRGRKLLVAGGGEVLVLGLVAGQAKFGGEARVEPDQGVRVGVGDGVDRGLRARGPGCRAWGSIVSVVTRPRLARRAAVMKESLNFSSRGCASMRRGRASAPAAAAAGGPSAGRLGFSGAAASLPPRDRTTAVSAASSSAVGSPLTTASSGCSAGPARPRRSVSAGRHSGMFPCFLAGRLARLSRSARRPLTICSRVSDGAITAST